MTDFSSSTGDLSDDLSGNFLKRSSSAVSSPTARATASPPNILVVDDTPDNLRLFMKVLSAQGYLVRPANDGQMAITAAQLDPPDLILLDVKMPGMDGYEVCKHLKADENTRDIPVMFLTVLDEASDVVKGFALGGVDYVTKPVKPEELLARINNQLQLRSLQQQLVEQESFLRSIYNNAEASISVLDVLGEGEFRIVEVNETALRMSGLARDQIEGMDLSALLPKHIIQEHHQACVELGLPVTHEEPVDINGETIWWLSTHTPLFNEKGEIHRIIGTGVNITERKQAELQLARKTQELSQTLETLKATQGNLIRAAKMAALGNLVAGVAHEINTPVGTAITSASTLENATQSILKNLQTGELKRSVFEDYLEVAAECSHLILNNLTRAGELVQSFKQVAVDQTSLKARTFNLKEYLQEIVTNLTPTIKQTPHRIVISGSHNILLHSYPGALSQVMTNLIMNSLSHAYPNFAGDGDNSEALPYPAGTLHIAVHQQPGEIIVQYSDDGCGIPLVNQHRIFEPFFTTARKLGGSGLGLHLIYNLVTQTLQGSINVSSVPGTGTTFTLFLPNRIAEKVPD